MSDDPFAMLEQDHRQVERIEAAGRHGVRRGAPAAGEPAGGGVVPAPGLRGVGPVPAGRAQLDSRRPRRPTSSTRWARQGLSKLQELQSAPGFGAAVEMVQGGIGHHSSATRSKRCSPRCARGSTTTARNGWRRRCGGPNPTPGCRRSTSRGRRRTSPAGGPGRGRRCHDPHDEGRVEGRGGLVILNGRCRRHSAPACSTCRAACARNRAPARLRAQAGRESASRGATTPGRVTGLKANAARGGGTVRACASPTTPWTRPTGLRAPMTSGGRAIVAGHGGPGSSASRSSPLSSLASSPCAVPASARPR